MDSTSPSRITLVRRSREDVQQRQVIVSLDGRPWATLLFGDSATREVEPGDHAMRIHNTLVWKTIDLHLEPGGHARFSVANRAGWGTYWMLSLVGVGPLYLSVVREDAISGP